MNNMIIGTAGHVDHGKTSLIRALTNIDTDRLKEEKKRGMTIEIGFAYLLLKNDIKVGIIDVPGHEKFIKNMLAGAGGIDIALLIVSAGEGIMPQTKEHLHILKLLGINKGIVVITKCDTVDEDFISIVKEEIKDLVKGSFLETANVVETSANTGVGIEELKEKIEEIITRTTNKDLKSAFRVPIDRVFSVDGFGTVATGTLIEGTIKEGQDVCLYPSNVLAKVRSLQVHTKNVNEAYCGQRVAINLTGIKKEEIKKGDVLAKANSMNTTMMLDVKLTVLAHSNRVIKNGSRLHIYHGTKDTICKVILLDKDEIKQGEVAYAQLRLENEMALKYKDHYIVRFYSPLETVGGGIILNPFPKKHKRNEASTLKTLKIFDTGSEKEVFYEVLKNLSARFCNLEYMATYINIDKDKAETYTKELVSENKVILITKDIFIDKSFYDAISLKATTILKNFYQQNRFQKGMKLEEFKNKILNKVDSNISTCVIERLCKDGVIINQNNMVCSKSFLKEHNNEEKLFMEKLETLYIKAGFTVPSKDEVVKDFVKMGKVSQIIDAMLADKTLIAVNKQMFFHKSVYEEALSIVKQYITNNGSITMAQFRDITGSSRKYSLAILEHFDAKGITKKVDEARVLSKKV